MTRGDVVLGICAFTHDSSAVLLCDGELRGFVEEERLSGEKHTKAYPRLAVDWLLTDAGLRPADVAAVAYNFAAGRFLAGALRAAPAALRTGSDERARPRAGSFLAAHAAFRDHVRTIGARFPDARVRQVPHHRAHGWYAFLASGFERAAVVTLDSIGESQTASVARAARTQGRLRYRTLLPIHDPHSLGYAYGAITQHLGWKRGLEEGTVMALAALGDPARFRPLLRAAIRLDPDGFTLDTAWFPARVLGRPLPRTSSAFRAATCPPRQSDDPIEPVHTDLAAALQERTEEVMLHLARLAARHSNERRLCLGGGVALNCVGVGRVVASGLFDEVFVPPAPGDSGTPIGAAAAVHQAHLRCLPRGLERAVYLGPTWSADEVRSRVTARGLPYHPVSDPPGFLAEQLTAGRVIGLFQGRAEAGPRALGNRSILASPLLADIPRRLSEKIKFREPFRPFAPVVLADQARDWFELGQESPYMSIAARATARAASRLATIVHANGTARVQTVTAAQNPLLAATLAEFQARTGVPVLINTSLNVKGQPMCATPDRAFDCLLSCGLDGLLIEGLYVTSHEEHPGARIARWRV